MCCTVAIICCTYTVYFNDIQVLSSFVDYTTAGLAIISQQDPQHALIKYFPSLDEQRQYSDDGFSGQFVVRYDIDRELDAGDILVSFYCYDCKIIKTQPIRLSTKLVYYVVQFRTR